jgi:hypothetical protein
VGRRCAARWGGAATAREVAVKKIAVVVCVLVGMMAVSFGTLAASSDAWIPGLASFVLPGLGQLLNDQMDKAVLHFAVGVGIGALGYGISWYVLPGAWYLVPAAYFAWSIYSGYDAYTVAKEQHFTLGLVDGGVGFTYEF